MHKAVEMLSKYFVTIFDLSIHFKLSIFNKIPKDLI
jgi:hypothetical protein